MSSEGLSLRPLRTKFSDVSQGASESERRSKDGDEAGGDGGLTEPVTPAGRVFIQPKFSCVIVCIIGFKNKIDIPMLKQGLLESLVRHKRFSSVMRKDENGSHYWVRTEVNIDDHLVIPPASAVNVGSETKIEDYAGKLSLALAFDESRPLWEIHVLNIKSRDAAASVVLRIHHSLGDGMSVMSLFLACTRSAANPELLPSVRPISIRGSQNPKGNLHGPTFNLWSRTFLLLLTVWYTLVEGAKVLLVLLGVKDSQSPLKGSPGVEHLEKAISVGTVSLNDMSIVKNAVGATINDVFLGIVCSGIRRYLQQHVAKLCISPSKHQARKASGASSSTQEKCFDALRIRATSLVNTRAKPGLQALAAMMQEGSPVRWGNAIGYIITPIYLRKCDDPLDYVCKAKEVIDRKKHSLEAILSYWIAEFLVKLLGAKVAAAIMYGAVMNTTMSLSNMVGPLEETMFMGNPITEIIPTVFGQPQALCIHLQSYMGKARIVLTSAKDVVAHPDILLQHIVDSLEDMKQAASARAR